MARSEAAAPTASRRVTLAGDGERTVDVTERRAPRETVRATLRCASGDRWTGEWRGVPVDWLMERTPGGADTTHLRVRSADGHVACVPVSAALNGVLAVERVDGEGTLAPAARPRFVALGVAGARTVKAVERVELVALDPGESAEEYEALATVG